MYNKWNIYLYNTDNYETRNLLNIKLAQFNLLIERFRFAIHRKKTEDNRQGFEIFYLMFIPILLSRSVSRVETVPERREGSTAVAGCCDENKDVTLSEGCKVTVERRRNRGVINEISYG